MHQVFVVCLLHFNLQYVAGGLNGLWASQGWPDDNDSIEDQIIVQSFEPVLDLLKQHPTWGMDLEMQGYMVDVLAERHPDVLAELRDLADAGQVEIVSFHWSDQLWTAYPRHDEEVSLDLVADSFARADLPLSKVVFTQEGQFSEGMLPVMAEHGYEVAVLPRNLATFWWGGPATSTLYEKDGVIVVPSNGLHSTDDSYEVQWAYFDDGELLATNDENPYAGPYFVTSPASIAAFEQDLEDREANGAQIVSIGAYVDAVRDQGTTPLPPVLDGDWQPDNTGNLDLWMGRSGLFGHEEADNDVLTANVRASRAVTAAEQVVAGEARGESVVRAAWKSALLGQVSDATGWNPYPTEVAYGLDHAAKATAQASGAIRTACAENRASAVQVDLASGAITWDPPAPAEEEPASAPDLEVTTEGRAGTLTWTRDPTVSDVVDLQVDFPVAGDDPKVLFPWDGLSYETTSALADDAVQSVDAGDIAADDFGLPLPLGLVHLTGDTWLVTRNDSVHLAAHFSKADRTVSFEDQTADEVPVTWRFRVVTGSADRALAVAQRTNATPVVTLPCPEGTAITGCGCATGGPGGAAWGWPLLLALVLRRRRRGAEAAAEAH